MRYLILGNGAAGITAAEKLRELCSTDQITIIGNENVPVYTKCMLPDYVGGKLERDKLFLRNFDSYKSMGIEFQVAEKIEGIDAKNKRVYLGDGLSKEYDRLLVATGGIPFVPPIEGLDQVDYFTINSILDADVIKGKAQSGKTVVILGAGLTGIEMAFALIRHGMKVCIVEKEERIIPRQLDNGSSDLLIEDMEKQGVEFYLGAAAVKVNPGENKTLELSNGKVLKFEMLIVAIGTRPNFEFMKNSGIDYSRGLLVDEYMNTSDENVFAAGDVSEVRNKPADGYVPAYVWPNAMAQGKCAALNMVGQKNEFSSASILQNCVQLRDVQLFSMGLINPVDEGYEVLVSQNKEKGIYKKLILKDNVIKGMICLGDNKKANTIAGYIRKGMDITEIKESLLV